MGYTVDDKSGLPPYTAAADDQPSRSRPRPRWRARKSRAARLLGLTCLVFIAYSQWRQLAGTPKEGPSKDVSIHGLSINRLQEDLATCGELRAKIQDAIGAGRQRNARYLDGHAPTLIQNASVWVGEPTPGTSAEDARRGVGFGWTNADVYLELGLIQRVETAGTISLAELSADTVVFDANGRPLTTGIIDMHSHAGVSSLPSLVGNEDTNELSDDITPYVRSIDGIQPNDHQIQVIKSGGVTTSLVLPGSGNNMGGEAFVIKLAVGKPDGRNETSAADMLADPDRTWRYMKMACGENPKRVYGRRGEHGPTSRLGESWEFRHAFEQAAKLVREQDDWCAAADAVGVENMHGYLPAEIRWESLGALLRGQVLLNTHCYTIPDLEAFVDHTNEFKFKVRAFHHAHQTYLVPEILKRAWGDDPPASALFADNMWYKAEAYVGSEYAGKHLYENGLTPIYVSDNPVLNAQHVLFEAAKAYKYGLPYHAALASVTTAPAERLGLSERVGKIKPGFDADVVVWDSDPLSVGATPVQLWIDGTSQFDAPVKLSKPNAQPIIPDENLAQISEEATQIEDVIFTGVSQVFLSTDAVDSSETAEPFNVAVSKGKIICIGTCQAELHGASETNTKIISLKNGYLTESLTAFGSTLGLNAVDAERDTDNGADSDVAFSRAADGLVLDNKKLHVSYLYGVTKAISAPTFSGHATHHGVSAGFLTGASTSLDQGAVFASDVAVHYTLGPTAKRGNTPSISAAVGALRKKLLDAAVSSNDTNPSLSDAYSETAYLRRVVTGSLPLSITVHSADTIAAILKVKAEVEQETSNAIRLVIIGGAESWLVADDLANAGVGVVLAPLQSYATSWDERRALTGAPLTNGTAVDVLLDAGVLTAIGLPEDWWVRDLSLLAGTVYRNRGGRLSPQATLDLVSSNVYRMLGLESVEPKSANGHFVVYEGSPLEIGGRVRAVSGGKGVVSVFE